VGKLTNLARLARLHWKQALFLLAAFLPALATAGLIDRFAVNVPIWDDWERVSLIS